MLFGNRRYKLTVGDKVIEYLRIRFSVQTRFTAPKKAKIEIFGLSPETTSAFNSLQRVDLDLIDNSGNVTNIFSGGLLNLEQKKEGAEYVVTLHAWSGTHPSQYKLVPKTFEARQTGGQVMSWLEGVLKEGNIRVEYTPQAKKKIDEFVFETGKSYNYTSLKTLEKVCQTMGVQYTGTSDSVIISIPRVAESISNLEHTISAETSTLLGIPRVTGFDELFIEVEVSSVLDPSVEASDIANLKSQYYTLAGDFIYTSPSGIRGATGKYIIESFEHVGDTHGDDWMTNYELYTDIGK